jgi:plasmid replication initiation protein
MRKDLPLQMNHMRCSVKLSINYKRLAESFSFLISHKLLEEDPNRHIVYYHLALFQYDKSRRLAEHEEMTTSELISLSKQSTANVETAIKLKPEDNRTSCLAALIYIENVKKVTLKVAVSNFVGLPSLSRSRKQPSRRC